MRKLMTVAVAAVLGAVLIAGAQARVAGLQKVAKTVTLTGWASSPAETDALKTTIKGFERANPGYSVNYAPINGDYPAAMLAKFAARKTCWRCKCFLQRSTIWRSLSSIGIRRPPTRIWGCGMKSISPRAGR